MGGWVCVCTQAVPLQHQGHQRLPHAPPPPSPRPRTLQPPRRPTCRHLHFVAAVLEPRRQRARAISHCGGRLWLLLLLLHCAAPAAPEHARRGLGRGLQQPAAHLGRHEEAGGLHGPRGRGRRRRNTPGRDLCLQRQPTCPVDVKVVLLAAAGSLHGGRAIGRWHAGQMVGASWAITGWACHAPGVGQRPGAETQAGMCSRKGRARHAWHALLRACAQAQLHARAGAGRTARKHVA